MRLLLALTMLPLLVACSASRPVTRVIDYAHWSDEAASVVARESRRVVRLRTETGTAVIQRKSQLSVTSEGLEYQAYNGRWVHHAGDDIREIAVTHPRPQTAMMGFALGAGAGALSGYAIGGRSCAGWFDLSPDCWKKSTAAIVFGLGGGFVGALVGSIVRSPGRTTLYRFGDRGQVVATHGGLSCRVRLGG